MRVIFYLFVFLTLFLTAPIFNSALAVSVDITSFPSTITDQEFSITASVSGNISGTNYLKADIFKENTQNYFGETYNGSSWYSGNDGLSYYPVIISNGIGNATFKVKIGNPNSIDFPGSGSYKLRIRRYTSSNSYSIGDQTPVDVTINWTAPTSTPTVTPVPTSTQTPTPSPLPTPSSTPTPTVYVFGSQNNKVNQQAQQMQQQQRRVTPTKSPLDEVLGASDFLSPTKANKASIGLPSINNQGLGVVFIIIGVVFLIFCAIVVVWTNKDLFFVKLKNDDV